MNWKDTLPRPRGESGQEHAENALMSLAGALFHHRRGRYRTMLVCAGEAAAEVRAWRHSLLDQGVRTERE